MEQNGIFEMVPVVNRSHLFYFNGYLYSFKVSKACITYKDESEFTLYTIIIPEL